MCFCTTSWNLTITTAADFRRIFTRKTSEFILCDTWLSNSLDLKPNDHKVWESIHQQWEEDAWPVYSNNELSDISLKYLSDAAVATHDKVPFNGLYKSQWVDLHRTSMPLLQIATRDMSLKVTLHTQFHSITHLSSFHTSRTFTEHLRGKKTSCTDMSDSNINRRVLPYYLEWHC